MNIAKLFLIALPLFAASTPALAQSPEAQEREAERREREAEAREMEHAEALREAEARLEEAAARVAELSTRNLPEMMLAEERMMSMKGRPRIGITIAPNDEVDGPVEGVRIIGVTPGSAATDAGLRSGDVITSVNGESMSGDSPMAANKRLLGLVKGVEEGDKLEIEYLRDGNVGKCTVEPRVIDKKMFVFRGPGAEDFEMEIPVAPGAPGAPLSLVFGGVRGWADLELVELNEGLGKYFGTKDGLLVVKAPNSGALKLEDGDVIQSIDGREPQSVGHAIRILSSYQPGEKLELSIMRDKESRKLEVEVPDDRTSFQAPLPPRPVAPEPPALPVLDRVPMPAVPVLAPTPAMATPATVRETRT